jgi:transposase-like protein
MFCTHCGSEKYAKNGVSNGVQRYKCKKCNRTFGDKIRKFTYLDKLRFLELYMNNNGIRASARILGCSPALLVKLVRELAANLRRDLAAALDTLSDAKLLEIIEMDEIYTRVKLLRL